MPAEIKDKVEVSKDKVESGDSTEEIFKGGMMSAFQDRRGRKVKKNTDTEKEKESDDESEDDHNDNIFDNIDIDRILSGEVPVPGPGVDEDDDSDEDEDDEGGDNKESIDVDNESTDSESKEDEDIDLVTDDGSPISGPAKVAFKTLREAKDAIQSQLTEIEDKQKDLVPSSDLNSEKKRADDLQEKLDLLDFRESTDFKSKYQEPISKFSKEASKWLSAIDESSQLQAKALLSSATQAIHADDEPAFFVAVDKITEDLLPGAGGSRFAASMGKLWDASADKRTAESDMESARESITKSRQENAVSSVKVVDAVISTALEGHEKRHKPVIDFYNSDPVREKFKYKETSSAAMETARKDIQSLLATGSMSDRLASLIVNGTMTATRDTERTLLMTSLQGFQQQLSKKDSQIKGLEDKLKKVSVKKGTFRRGDEGDVDKEDKDDGKSYGMTERMRARRKNN